MSLVGDLRAGLRENIKANISGWQVSPYRLSSPTPPGIHIVRGPIRWHGAFGGGAVQVDFRVQAFAAIAEDISSQIRLDELLDVMVPALESDKTLGGVADDVVVQQEIPEEQLLLGADGLERLIAEWLVTIYVNVGSI